MNCVKQINENTTWYFLTKNTTLKHGACFNPIRLILKMGVCNSACHQVGLTQIFKPNDWFDNK